MPTPDNNPLPEISVSPSGTQGVQSDSSISADRLAQSENYTFSDEAIENIAALGAVLRQIQQHMTAEGIDMHEYKRQLESEEEKWYNENVEFLNLYVLPTQETKE